MAEIVLDQPQVAPGMGQGVTAGMAQYMWVHRAEPGSRRDAGQEIVHRLPGQWPATLRQKQPGQRITTTSQIAPQCPNLIPRQRLAGGQPMLQPLHPEPARGQIEIRPPQGDQLADPQPVPVHQQQHEMIARAVPAGPGRSQQALDLIGGQVISAAPMRIHRRAAVTLNKMLVGALSGHLILPCDFWS